jgi:2-succinyl-5-enolpyruvyl-6-hydroxy-3-cyclohexene-1-carboxylate synthase
MKTTAPFSSQPPLSTESASVHGLKVVEGATVRSPVLPARADNDATTFRGLVQGDAELNFQWAALLIDSLVASGVEHVVMSPGAQMIPLSLACRHNDKLKVSVVIDERSAAFYALGLAKMTRKPTILICTSGSAVGQYYPAIMEANTGMVPLIVLTSDRAPENQDRCSAQAIDQVRAFGQHVRAAHQLTLPDNSISQLLAVASRVYEQATWPMPGPVHVNMPFRDPLVPKTRTKLAVLPKPPVVAAPCVLPNLNDILEIAGSLSGRRGAIVCGASEIEDHEAFFEAVQVLAQTLGCPVITDPLSNMRFGAPDTDLVMSRGDSFLRSNEFADSHQPEWVLNFGGPPTSKSVLTWMQKSPTTDYIVVDQTPRWADPLQKVTRMVRSNAAEFCRALVGTGVLKSTSETWAESFAICERQICAMAEIGTGNILWEAPIIRAILDNASDGSAVFSGNSMSVRDFDTFSGTRDKQVRLIANRGTNGIDGAIATLTGVAAAQGSTVLGMIGDMTFSHDMGSLQLAGKVDVVLVVLNNGGGAIFEYLPTKGTPEYQDFLSPPTMDVCLSARACGWQTWRADDMESFTAAMAEAMAGKGPRLIEAVIDRDASVSCHKAFWSAAEQLKRPHLVSVHD